MGCPASSVQRLVRSGAGCWALPIRHGYGSPFSVSARADARLVSLTAGFAYRIYRLQPAGLRIGRDGGQCDLVAPGPTVSRCHACVRAHGADTWRIEDLDSTNGVFVNDRRIDGAATLEDGHVIGRAGGCDIPMPFEPTVSSRHAVLRVQGGVLCIADNASLERDLDQRPRHPRARARPC
ncbi:MAG: FHA domain-containing protein [Desulfobulbus sp.]|jgi:pSer/pThr/pTyr-binding forkhead associated (FHA) protein|nr:FHA domain-containing protein [Desulfobulbus sp.]